MRETAAGERTDRSWERVYREHGPRLWRAVLMYTGDREIASDAVAEAFAQGLGRGDGVRAPERWVWRAAFRIAAGELQRRRMTDRIPTDIPAEMPEAPGLLVTALGRLSPKQRASVVLHYYAGYRLREVAQIIGSTTSAVGVHLNRARNRLRDLLRSEDDD